MTSAKLTKALQKASITDISLTAKSAADLDGISGLGDLDRLTITAKIPVLPAEVFALTKLKALTIKGKTLQRLDGIHTLRKLESLYLDANDLRELPQELGELGRLDLLSLENNQVGELPASAARLSKLSNLHLDKNPLGELPAWLCELPELGTFTANKVGLRALPQSLARCRALRSLHLDDNPGIDVGNLRDMPALRSLSLKNCKLETLPEQFASLTHLTWLCLAKNPLVTVPAVISELRQLEILFLWACKLETVPPSLGELVNLRWLELERNAIRELPIELGQLQKLRELLVDRNRLGAFPEAILQMRALTKLDVGQNQIAALPDALNQLTKLEFFDARDNPATHLPEDLSALTELSSCRLAGVNPDKDWPRSQINALPPNAYLTYNEQEIARDGHWEGDPAPPAPPAAGTGSSAPSRELARLPIARHVGEVRFADETRVVVIESGGVQLFDLNTENTIYESAQPGGWCVAIAGERMLTAMVAACVRDLSTGELIRTFDPMTRGVAAVDISPDGTLGLAVDGLGHIRVFVLTSGEVLAQWDAEGDGTDGRFSPDGTQVLSSGKRAFRLWRIQDGSFKRAVGDKMRVQAVHWLPGERVLSAGFDSTVKIWDTARKKPKVVSTLDLGGSYMSCLDTTRDSTRVLVGDSDGVFRYFDLASGEVLAQWPGHLSFPATSVAISPNGRTAASAGQDEALRVWALPEG